MKLKLLALALGTFGLLVFTGYTLWVGVPYLLSSVVRLVPVSLEDKMGRAVVAGVARQGMLCNDGATRELVEAIRKRLVEAMPPSPYQFEIQVVRNPTVNAMAAPGGHIVVFSGLIDQMDSPEQLAAVLAHEMQHVVQRHSTRGIVRAVGLQAFLALVIGDPGLIGDLAGNLTVLHFIRSDEQSADDEALKTLVRAGIPPMAMIKAFENLARHEGTVPGGDLVKYLSTHPPLTERIEKARAAAARSRMEPRPIAVPMTRNCAVMP